ncbi:MULTISPECIES: DHHW family protein [Anaerotruncus]|uniref:AlgX/AlgJ SGNH hydrolase-like domain-containing protein n=1 Tax=Anaerotruncus colihominis TaxID=169435 RepID=A0A845SZ66_9FIRM|nr:MULTISPECIES: DHHW family protein [Anaerotruncus]MCI8491500.1 hypothetical protein [Anaerotruncus sp.]MCR2024420.1 DHHW family protein [Anaerotruncus colihominis]NDO39783.1 hypothetical protein [Anaerotruncus colihominis]
MKYNLYKLTKHYRYQYRYSPADKLDVARAPDPGEERTDYYERLRRKFTPEQLRRLGWINIAVIGCALALFFLASLFLEKPVRSVIEKRDLARFPAVSAKALFSGGLTRDVETWYADTFPLRDAFVGLSAVVDESRGVRFDDVRIVAPSGGETQDIPPDASTGAPVPPAQPRDGQQNAAVSSDDASSGRDEQSEPFVPQVDPNHDHAVIDDGMGPGAINNGTFVYKGMAMSLFGGLRENGAWYAETINKYHSELPGVRIYDMVIPTAIEFYVPDKYRELTQSQKDMIDYIYGQLDPQIKRVDAYSLLQEHSDEYIYFRTDHHWTGLGAYYAYVAFCAQAGVTPLQISDFETRRLDDFIGTMYAQTQDTTLLKHPDYVDYYIFDQSYTAQRYDRGAPYTPVNWTLWGEYAKSPNSYSVFLHGDFPLVKVKTGIGNGRRIMVVKESFGNAFAPFLINHYDEVYIVDQRYFELGAIDFIKQNGINELIFANNSFAACTPYHIQCIDNMRHQGVYVAPPAQPPETPSESIPDVQEPSTQPPDESSVPQTPPAVPEVPYIPPQTYVPPQEPVASEPETDSQEDEQTDSQEDEQTDSQKDEQADGQEDELYEEMDDIERSRRLRARSEK